MSWNQPPYTNETNSYQQTDRQPKGNKIAIAIIAVVLSLVTIVVVIMGRTDKYTQSALAAARKVTPNAKVRDVKVSDGFAVATVSDPTGEGELRTGVLTYFKVNDDESMTQIASGNTPLPISLLELGISISTQADLNGSSVDDVMQNLTNECDFSENDSVGYEDSTGYAGFDGSFDPDGWQIDAGTLDHIKQVLNASLAEQSKGSSSNSSVVCVIATNNKSDVKTDTETYISTFSMELNFVDTKGDVSRHDFAFSIGPRYFRSYSLDGRNLPVTSD
jgi:hypothetical protein